MTSAPSPSTSPAVRERMRIRAGEYRGPTGPLAKGYVQTNIVIMPEGYADDFLRFCQLNPKPCPLLEVGTPGDPRLPGLGADIDIRSDVPAYRLFERGREKAVVHDIADVWTNDLVTFALGCSFSFEEALEEAGLGVRHNELGLINPMYTTHLPTRPAGPFGGPYVVSMRPFKPADAIRAIQVTSRFPQVHGAPIHFGDPVAIGIRDIGVSQHGGDAVPIYAGEVPVFWACGVTSQIAVMQAELPFCITHQPAHMLITDLRNAELAVI